MSTMKMSALIRQLLEIDDSTPFDADVYIGGPSQGRDERTAIVRVFHDAPDTVLLPCRATTQTKRGKHHGHRND